MRAILFSLACSILCFSTCLGANESPIFKSILDKDFVSVESIVKSDPKAVNERNSADLTPLEFAIENHVYDLDKLDVLSSGNTSFNTITDKIKGTVVNGNSGLTIDYAKLWGTDTKIMFLGEFHSVVHAAEPEVIKILEKAKELGITHYATEFQFSTYQSAIDDYLNGIISFDALKGSKNIGDRDINIIKKAKELGIKVIALDLDSRMRDNKEGFWGTTDQRNRHWFDLIDKKISEAKKKGIEAKVLIYCGSAHGKYNEYAPFSEKPGATDKKHVITAAERLSSKYKVFSIFFLEPYDIVHYAANKLNAGAKKFIIYSLNDNERDHILHWDAIIHVPSSDDKSSPPTKPDSLVSSEYEAAKNDCEKNGNLDSCLAQAALAKKGKRYEEAEGIYRNICQKRASGNNSCFCLSELEIQRGDYTTITMLCSKQEDKSSKYCTCNSKAHGEKECGFLTELCERK